MATATGTAAASARWGIVTSDQIVRDLHIPVMEQALELQDLLFTLADDIGIGDEVRTLVYGVRSLEYAGTLAANLLPAGAAAAGASVLAGAGAAFGALGAIGAVAVALDLLFGDDEEEKQRARDKQSRRALLALLKRLDLEGFAKEQDERKATEQVLSTLPWAQAEAAAHREAARKAALLAEFYRRAGAVLTPHDRALFVSLSNLGRWQAARAAYEALGHDARSRVTVLVLGAAALHDVTMGKPVKDFGARLATRLELELGTFRTLEAQALWRRSITIKLPPKHAQIALELPARPSVARTVAAAAGGVLLVALALLKLSWTLETRR